MSGLPATVSAGGAAGAAEPADAIRSDGFSFWYGKNQALHEITLGVAPRAVTALIGPSGCGKSTFLRSLNRLQELLPNTRHRGDITFDGASIFAPGVDAVALRRRIGMEIGRAHV
jgi:phosphate transport system ATP-binding protein